MTKPQPKLMEHTETQQSTLAPPTFIMPEFVGLISSKLLMHVVGWTIANCLKIKVVDPLRAKVEELKRRINAMNGALDKAQEEITDLQASVAQGLNALPGAEKVHVPKMDLPKEFFGKPNDDVKEFLIDCNMYIAAQKAEFTKLSATPLMALGRL